MDAVGQDADEPAGREPKVPGYQVRRRLGSGASAVVWLVEEEATGRKFALKLPVSGSPAARSRADAYAEEDIRRELLIMSVLDHGHLVKAHNVVTVGERPDSAFGVLMDYAPGGSLGQLVAARGRLSVGETVTVLTPIAQVLAYLHGKGFTHSDVSPGNILFSGQGKPLLADLGLARMVGDPAGTPDAGTAGFQDPAPVDAVRAGLQPGRDVYAAAAVGWYCLTGGPPLPAADRPPLPVLAPDVPPELAAALEAGLSEDRRQRPDAAELATAIYRSAGAAPVDLSRSVDPSVLPELLTRRPEPPARGRHRERLNAWGRRLHTSAPARALRRRWDAGSESGTDTSRESTPVRAADSAPAAGASRRGRHGTSPGRHSRHSRHSAAVARHRARAVWGALLAVPVIGGAWLLPPSPSSDRLQIGTGTAPNVTAPEVAAPRVAGPNVTAPNTTEPNVVGQQVAAVPDSVRRQLQSENPVEAVKGLAALRSLALSQGRLELLGEVNASHSPAATADLRISTQLQKTRTVLAGFTTSLADIRRLPESTGERAVVAVTSATTGYVQRSAAGAVAATGPAQPAVDLRLVLLKVKGKWLVSEILPAR
jgi:serine/threonine protein kinase